MYLDGNLGQRNVNTSSHDPSSPSSPPSLELPLLDSPPPSSSSSSSSSTFFPASFSVGEDPDFNHERRETGNRFIARDEARLYGADRHLISSSTFFGSVVVADDTKILVSSSSLSISFFSSAALWMMHMTLGNDGSPSSLARASASAGHPMLRLCVTNIGLNRATLLRPHGQ